MKRHCTLISCFVLLYGISIADGQESTSASSTIVQLSERSAKLGSVSQEKFRRPLEAIRTTLGKRVAEAVALREQLAADPTNRRLQAEFENTLSIAFTELDQHMADLHEGRDEMLGAVDSNLEVIRELRKELKSTAQTQTEKQRDIDRQANVLDQQLDKASQQFGPLLAAGEEIPADVEALVQIIKSDLHARKQQVDIAGAAVGQLAVGAENLRRFEELLTKRRAQLQVSYRAIEGQRAVIGSLVGYRKQRVENQRLTHELGEFAQGIADLTDGLSDFDLTQLGAISIDESGDAKLIDFGDETRPSQGATELLRRYQESQSSDKLVQEQ